MNGKFKKYIASILGNSIAINNVRELVLNYSSEEEPILLIGETGVGKNHIAELIHVSDPFAVKASSVY